MMSEPQNVWEGSKKNVDLLKCVWTKMTISLNQVDIIMGQHI